MQSAGGNLTPIFATPFASLSLPVTGEANLQVAQLLAERATA